MVILNYTIFIIISVLHNIFLLLDINYYIMYQNLRILSMFL